MAITSPGELLAQRYRIEVCLGRGGYGEVWRALDTHRNHRVALKLLLNRDRRQAWHEASLLTALKSPHILEVNNADLVVDVPYLDTALAKDSLDRICTPNGVEAGQAVDWVRRALRGLDLCHRRGLLHRDVKPHNLFLSEEGDARLGDFGIAALMDSDGSADAHGDPRIWAPEFYDGGRATVASDIYATAVTLYWLLAGRPPFDQARTEELEKAIRTGDCPDVRELAPNVGRALANKVRAGMALDPDQRFESASEFDAKMGALSPSRRRFKPLVPHPNHERCWVAEGSGKALDICVIDGESKRKLVETRRTGGGNRVNEHCDELPRRDLPRRLRKVFDALR